LDDAFENYEDCEDKLRALHEFLNKALNANDYVKIHKTEKSGIVLQITSTRSELLKPFFAKHEQLQITPQFTINAKTIKFKKTSSSSSLMEIQSPEIDLLIHELHTFECKCETWLSFG
jgi:small-conductance mechanosensitive channel